MIQQKRLGYLIFDGEESPVATARLRDVPFDDWLESDFLEEIELLRQQAQQRMQKADEMDWLNGIIAPLWKDHPDAVMSELVELLPEPDRTRARAMLHATVPVDALPIEQMNRQPWHRKVENAIAALNRKSSFSIDDILAEAGIEKNSIERPAAAMYARRIMDALGSYPANVALPRPRAVS
jgi:hypothetical protein